MANSESKDTKRAFARGIFGRGKGEQKFSDPEEKWQPQAAPPPAPEPQAAPPPAPEPQAAPQPLAVAQAAPGAELKELMAKAVAEVEQEQVEVKAETEEKTEQGNDLLDIFTDNEEENLMLDNLARELEDIDIYQLLKDCLELSEQMIPKRDRT